MKEASVKIAGFRGVSAFPLVEWVGLVPHVEDNRPRRPRGRPHSRRATTFLFINFYVDNSSCLPLNELHLLLPEHDMSLSQRSSPVAITAISSASLSPLIAVDRRRIRGLTLTEMLVSLMLIAILAAVLLPVIGSARERSLSAQCVSRLRQAGLLVLAMAQDRQRIIETSFGGSGWGVQTWSRKLAASGYLPPDSGRSRDFLYCPAGSPGSYLKEREIGGWGQRTYGINQTAPGGHLPPPSEGSFEKKNSDDPNSRVVYLQIHLNRLEALGRTWLLADSIGNTSLQSARIRRAEKNNPGCLHLRHQGRANVFFADGSLVSVGADDLYSMNILDYAAYDHEILRATP